MLERWAGGENNRTELVCWSQRSLLLLIISDLAHNALATLVQLEDLHWHLSILARAAVLGGFFTRTPSTRMLLPTSKEINRQMAHLETSKTVNTQWILKDLYCGPRIILSYSECGCVLPGGVQGNKALARVNGVYALCCRAVAKYSMGANIRVAFFGLLLARKTTILKCCLNLIRSW